MANYRLILLLASMALVSGCAAPSAPPLAPPGDDHVPGDAVAPAPPAEPDSPAAPTDAAAPFDGPQAPERRPVRVYASSGWLVGTAPVHPLKDGSLVGESQGVRRDSFVAPPGTGALKVAATFVIGAWSGGVEVLDGSGAVVYRQDHALSADDGGAGACTAGRCTEAHVGTAQWSADVAHPGNYTVLYRIAGAVFGTVSVVALVEG